MATLNCRNDVVAAGSLCITLIFRDSSSIITASHLFLVIPRFDRVLASDLFAFGILLNTHTHSDVRKSIESPVYSHTVTIGVFDMNYDCLSNCGHSKKMRLYCFFFADFFSV